MKKKALYLFLPIILFFLQCRGSLDQEKNNFTDNSAKKSGSLLLLRMFSAENENFKWNTDNPVARKISEKTNVAIRVENTRGNPDAELLLMLTDKNYPDLVYAKGSYSKFIDAGIFIPLDDLIEKYGPNIKKFYGKDFKRLRYSPLNPHIYFLGSFPVRDEQWDVQGVFGLQLDVVKTLRYPRLKTLSDYENAIREYKRRYPEIEGNPTIGLSLIAHDWRFFISVTNPAFYATGGPNDGEWYIDPVTYKAILHYRRPIEREYFRWLNHMNAIGLLDPESFIQTYEQYQAKIFDGRVLGVIDAEWDIQSTEDRLLEKGKPGWTYGAFPIAISEDIKSPLCAPAVYSSRWGIGITDKCPDPVKAIKFFDYLLSDEGQVLVHWGIKGIHYSADRNGRRYFTPDQSKMRKLLDFTAVSGVNMFIYPFPEYGRGVLDPGGQPYLDVRKEEIKNEYNQLEIEILKAYGAEYWKDLYPSEENFPVRPYGVAWQIDLPPNSEAQFIFDECARIIKKRITEAILTDPKTFDRVWNLLLDELKAANVTKLEEEFSRKVQERISFWKE